MDIATRKSLILGHSNTGQYARLELLIRGYLLCDNLRVYALFGKGMGGKALTLGDAITEAKMAVPDDDVK